jgi:hypothetical protein
VDVGVLVGTLVIVDVDVAEGLGVRVGGRVSVRNCVAVGRSVNVCDGEGKTVSTPIG